MISSGREKKASPNLCLREVLALPWARLGGQTHAATPAAVSRSFAALDRLDREDRRRDKPARLGRREEGASATDGRRDDSPLEPPFSRKLTVLDRRRTPVTVTMA